jgi:hypothetical protein
VNLNDFAVQQNVINGDRIFYETLTLRMGQFTRFAGEWRLRGARRVLKTQTASRRKKKENRGPELESSVKYQIM